MSTNKGSPVGPRLFLFYSIAPQCVALMCNNHLVYNQVLLLATGNLMKSCRFSVYGWGTQEIGSNSQKFELGAYRENFEKKGGLLL